MNPLINLCIFCLSIKISFEWQIISLNSWSLASFCCWFINFARYPFHLLCIGFVYSSFLLKWSECKTILLPFFTFSSMEEEGTEKAQVYLFFPIRFCLHLWVTLFFELDSDSSRPTLSSPPCTYHEITPRMPLVSRDRRPTIEPSCYWQLWCFPVPKPQSSVDCVWIIDHSFEKNLCPLMLLVRRWEALIRLRSYVDSSLILSWTVLCLLLLFSN